MRVRGAANGVAGGLRIEPPAEALVFLGPDRPMQRIAVPELTLGPGEALVEVELATVCGSDVHTVLGHRKAAVPQVLGHEQIGRVVALGPGTPPTAVDGSPVSIGDRIVWSVTVGCGSCRTCRAGYENKCERVQKYGHEPMRRGWELSGGFSTHVHLLPRTAIVRVPETAPAEVFAPASCATATVAAMVDVASRTAPLDGATVVVTGCGMLGLTAVAMASAAGAVVVAVDPDADRRELAAQFGARAVAAPGADELRRALEEVGATGFDHGFEVSGANSAITVLLETASVGAVIVLAGSVFPAPAVPIVAEEVVRRLLTIRGVHNYRPEHLATAVEFLLGADQEAFAGLVGETIGFHEAPRALAVPAPRGTRVALRP